MIQAVSGTTPYRPLQPQRIVANAAVITLHLAAFGVLLAPLSSNNTPAVRSERTTVQLLPQTLPEPPPPPPLLATPVPPRQLPGTAHSIPVPQTIPVVVDTVDAAAVSALADQLQHMTAPAAGDVPALAGPAIQQGLQVRHGPAPAYPLQAIRQHLQGEVLLRVQIDASGAVTEASIERSSGHRELDQAARRQVLRHWHFEPSITDGVPTPAIGLVPIHFRLD